MSAVGKVPSKDSVSQSSAPGKNNKRFQKRSSFTSPSTSSAAQKVIGQKPHRRNQSLKVAKVICLPSASESKKANSSLPSTEEKVQSFHEKSNSVTKVRNRPPAIMTSMGTAVSPPVPAQREEPPAASREAAALAQRENPVVGQADAPVPLTGDKIPLRWLEQGRSKEPVQKNERNPSPVQREELPAASQEAAPVQAPAPVQIEAPPVASQEAVPVQVPAPVQREEPSVASQEVAPAQVPAPVQIEAPPVASQEAALVQAPAPVQTEEAPAASQEAAPVQAPAPEIPKERVEFLVEKAQIALSKESLEAFINRLWRGTKEIKINQYSDISYDIISLRKCFRTTRLFLAALPNVDRKAIETMLSPRNGTRKVWSELEELHFSEIPVSDEALRLISLLPKLQRITLLECNEFTVQGLHHLMKGCPSLISLFMSSFSAIDPFAIEEFQKALPNVQLEIRPVIDPTMSSLVMDEADRRMQDPDLPKRFIFLQKLVGSETSEIKWDSDKASLFYENRVQALGIQAKIDPEKPIEPQCLYFEQILQAYLNISRAAWAVKEELVRLGFFNKGQGESPKNVKEIIDLLDQEILDRVKMKEVLNQLEEEEVLGVEVRDKKSFYAEKIQVLDFTDLRLTYVPYFILDQMKWLNLETIILKGNQVGSLPDIFKQKCPKLATIEFSNRKEYIKESQPSKGMELKDPG